MKVYSDNEPVIGGETYKTIELTLQQFAATVLFDDVGMDKTQVRAFVDSRIEMLAHQLSAVFHSAANVLQQKTIVAEYPINLVHYILRALHLPYKRVQHKLSESILYPTVPINIGRHKGYPVIELTVREDIVE